MQKYTDIGNDIPKPHSASKKAKTVPKQGDELSDRVIGDCSSPPTSPKVCETDDAARHLSLFAAASLSADEVRDKLALIDQAAHLMSKRHAEALWIGLGLPAPGRTKPARRVRPLPQDVIDFLAQATSPDPSGRVQAKLLYDHFRLWAERTGHSSMTMTAFGIAMRQTSIAPVLSRMKMYLGIKLSPYPTLAKETGLQRQKQR